MGGSPRRAKMPPAPPPAPTPEPLDDEALQKERAQRRQRLKSSGRAGTILTEGGLGGEPNIGRQTLLGGSV